MKFFLLKFSLAQILPDVAYAMLCRVFRLNLADAGSMHLHVVTKVIVINLNSEYISLEPKVLNSILNINLSLKNFTSSTEIAERVNVGQSKITN